VYRAGASPGFTPGYRNHLSLRSSFGDSDHGNKTCNRHRVPALKIFPRRMTGYPVDLYEILFARCSRRHSSVGVPKDISASRLSTSRQRYRKYPLALRRCLCLLEHRAKRISYKSTGVSCHSAREYFSMPAPMTIYTFLYRDHCHKAGTETQVVPKRRNPGDAPALYTPIGDQIFANCGGKLCQWITAPSQRPQEGGSTG